MRTAYKCRAYPTDEQAAILSRTFGCARVVWNQVLAWRSARYDSEGVTTAFAQTSALLTELKQRPDYALPATGSVLGVDLGLKDFAVLSNGGKIAHPRHMDQYEARLKRYQRVTARKDKGSNNREKAAIEVARAHARVTDARRDFLHKHSTQLVRGHDVVVIEDLAVGDMVRNRKPAKSISHTGRGEFRSLPTYKAARHGSRSTVIDRFHPSSKTCSACGHLLAELSLSTRHRACPGCGTLHDGDVNAAENILAAGLTVDACGAGVRRQGSSPPWPTSKQETRPVRAGIPRL